MYSMKVNYVSGGSYILRSTTDGFIDAMPEAQTHLKQEELPQWRGSHFPAEVVTTCTFDQEILYQQL